MGADKDKKLNYLFSVLSIAVMWAVWLIAHAIVRNEYIIPSFSDTIISIGEQFVSSRFWLSFALTIWRTIYAWLLAFVLAVIFASLSALSIRFYRFFADLFHHAPADILIVMLKKIRQATISFKEILQGSTKTCVPSSTACSLRIAGQDCPGWRSARAADRFSRRPLIVFYCSCAKAPAPSSKAEALPAIQEHCALQDHR